ncbi:unnamed protein product [Pipistrellus nathusii]|uniref:Uncharacterized protein n=1 Tax=Pipistrellus nathusii TaxID=59473 RepID=A0ABN9Z322_PIPNA
MAASEAAVVRPAAPASGVRADRAATRGAAASAASGLWRPPGWLRGSRPGPVVAKQLSAGPAPLVSERAVPGHADQHPVHRARVWQDPAQQPRAQHAPGQEPPPAGWHSKSNNKKRFENFTKILLLSN